jgi:DNA-binding NtrC family response regulator
VPCIVAGTAVVAESETMADGQRSGPCVRSRFSALVVDDDRLIRTLITEALTAAGADVHPADRAVGARQVLDTCHVDVALLDLHLPDCGDLTLLRDIHRLLPSLPVVLMTADGASNLCAAALVDGAHAVLMKPFDIDTLVPLLREAIGRAGAQDVIPKA